MLQTSIRENFWQRSDGTVLKSLALLQCRNEPALQNPIAILENLEALAHNGPVAAHPGDRGDADRRGSGLFGLCLCVETSAPCRQACGRTNAMSAHDRPCLPLVSVYDWPHHGGDVLDGELFLGLDLGAVESRTGKPSLVSAGIRHAVFGDWHTHATNPVRRQRCDHCRVRLLAAGGVHAAGETTKNPRTLTRTHDTIFHNIS